MMNRFAKHFGLAMVFMAFSSLPAQAELIYGLTTTNSLVTFDSATPGAVPNALALSGVGSSFVGGAEVGVHGGGVLALASCWVRVAPARHALFRDQDALQARGCGRSLIRILRLGEAGTK